MLRAICQTCQERTRGTDREEVDEFVVAHVRRGHRVTRRPADADEATAGGDGDEAAPAAAARATED